MRRRGRENLVSFFDTFVHSAFGNYRQLLGRRPQENKAALVSNTVLVKRVLHEKHNDIVIKTLRRGINSGFQVVR